MNTFKDFECLVQHANIGILVFNAEGKILFANAFLLELLGYEHDQLIGREIDQLFPALFTEKQSMFSRFANSPSKTTCCSTKDVIAVHNNGCMFKVELTVTCIQIAGRPFAAAYIAANKFQQKEDRAFKRHNTELKQRITNHTQSYTRSVKELKMQLRHVEVQDKELQKANAFLNSIWNNAGAMIIVTDTEGLIEMFNPAAEKYLGYRSEEIVGRQTPQFFHDKQEVQFYASRFTKELNKPVAAGFETFVAKARLNLDNQHEWTYIHKSGKRFPVDVTITALRDEQSEIIGFLGIAFDISEQKKAEIELRSALQKQKEVNDLKSRFVSIASHEFRTPLSTIVSSAYLIRQYKETVEQEKRNKHLDRILSCSNTLTNILDDFLSIGKLEEGRILLRPREFDVLEYMEKIIEDVRGIAKQHICYNHFGPLRINTDATLLKHIVVNLLSNAIKFSPEETTINIKTRVEHNRLEISVIDKGIGIPALDQQHLFELFYRASNAGNIQGTGLGLHIVKRYTELLGGQIFFTSQQDEGTQFRILLNKIISHEKDLAY